MSLQRRLAFKPVIEKPREQLFFLGQSDDAVTDVARREHAELAAQHSGAPSVVGDGDDGAEAADAPDTFGIDVTFETAEECGEACAATDRDDVEAVFHSRATGSAGGYFFFSSVRTSLATAFSVSNTPVPFMATASKVGSPLKL